MPWKRSCSMQHREEFVLKALQPGVNFSDLCREYEISRKTGYKWVKRFKERGLRGLEELARGPAPGRQPLACTADQVIEILQCRRAHPTWGPKKIRASLLRVSPGEKMPSNRTISRVLRRSGMALPRRTRAGRRAPGSRPDVVVSAPNDLWTVDFKGWWRSKDGKKCEPLTVRDAHSRYIIAVELVSAPSVDEVRPVFARLFSELGLPLAIQSDTGPPFATSHSALGMTRLSAWWVALGIRVVRSRVGCPQDNGGHERMHLDMARELERFPGRTRREQQQQCARWRHEFNHHRPHGALDQGVPADVYRRSPRVLPDAPPELAYPPHMVKRRISSCGTMRYCNHQRHVSVALAGYDVGVEPLPSQRFKVWFGSMCVGVGTLPWTAKLVPLAQFDKEEKERLEEGN